MATFHVTVEYLTRFNGARRKMLFDVEADSLQGAQKRADIVFDDRTKSRHRKVSTVIIPEGTYR